MGCLMNNEDIGSRRIYRQPLNYENGVLLAKIRDISLWRDTDIKSYESGVLTLSMLLPKELRDVVFDHWDEDTCFENLTMDGKKKFDNLFVFILKLLEDNNICFPKISFDLGHD